MNRQERELIANPPAKCPYFTKPDVAFFLTKADILEAERFNHPQHLSLLQLFGSVEKMSDDQQTQFLLSILQNAKFEPDYSATAKSLNIANGKHVQRRLEAIVRKQGFEIDGNQITNPGNKASEEMSTPKAKAKAKANSAKKTTTTPRTTVCSTPKPKTIKHSITDETSYKEPAKKKNKHSLGLTGVFEADEGDDDAEGEDELAMM